MRGSISRLSSMVIATAAVTVLASSASADLFIFTDGSGMSAEAEFILLNSTTLQVRLKNTSTGSPSGFGGAAQILTVLSWDFGAPGNNGGDTQITGGTVVIGPTSQTINFDTGSYGPGTNVGGEWGFGNNDSSGGLMNLISANTSGAVPFGGPNLDGPSSMDGPQGGLVANPPIADLGGQGAIQNEIIATLNLSIAISNLNFLVANGTQVEFGSDALFIGGQLVPAPGAMCLLGIAGLCGRRRRRR